MGFGGQLAGLIQSRGGWVISLALSQFTDQSMNMGGGVSGESIVSADGVQSCQKELVSLSVWGQHLLTIPKIWKKSPPAGI